MYKSNENEIIDEFANNLCYDDQKLKGCGANITSEVEIALIYALRPYPQLSISILQPLVGKCPILDLVEIFRRTELQCVLQYPKKKPYFNDNSYSSSSQPQLSSPSASSLKVDHNNKGTSSSDSSSVLCSVFFGKGSNTNKCPSNSLSKPEYRSSGVCL